MRHPTRRNSAFKLDVMDQDRKLDLRVESPDLGTVTKGVRAKTSHARATYLPARDPIAYTGFVDGDVLVPKCDRARLAAPTLQWRALAISITTQRRHFRFQFDEERFDGGR